MDNVKQIDGELTVSGQIDAEQLQQIVRDGFKSVLNLRSPNEPGFWVDEEKAVEAAGLHYLNLPVNLDTLTDERATEILLQMDGLPKPTLVHCGVSFRARILSLMKVATQQGMTPDRTFELAKQFGFDSDFSSRMKEFLENYVAKHSKVH